MSLLRAYHTKTQGLSTEKQFYDPFLDTRQKKRAQSVLRYHFVQNDIRASSTSLKWKCSSFNVAIE